MKKNVLILISLFSTATSASEPKVFTEPELENIQNKLNQIQQTSGKQVLLIENKMPNSVAENHSDNNSESISDDLSTKTKYEIYEEIAKIPSVNNKTVNITDEDVKQKNKQIELLFKKAREEVERQENNND